jgi:hypothetical protein
MLCNSCIKNIIDTNKENQDRLELFSVSIGSHLYNLNDEQSNVDIKSFFMSFF